ncbi:hypothetical protein V8G54_014382 [Vigna mungo]|uniref:Uncharacterized protein n=1 Tax=Vigna mungo TaxID=3915 RepID=A0AAQ3NHK5_VIGMU
MLVFMIIIIIIIDYWGKRTCAVRKSMHERRNFTDGDKVVTHSDWLVASLVVRLGFLLHGGAIPGVWLLGYPLFAGARQKLVVVASCGLRFRVVRMAARSVNGRWPWLQVNEEATLLMVVVRCVDGDLAMMVYTSEARSLHDFRSWWQSDVAALWWFYWRRWCEMVVLRRRLGPRMAVTTLWVAMVGRWRSLRVDGDERSSHNG